MMTVEKITAKMNTNYSKLESFSVSKSPRVSKKDLYVYFSMVGKKSPYLSLSIFIIQKVLDTDKITKTVTIVNAPRD